MTSNIDLDTALAAWLRSTAERGAPPHVLQSVAAATAKARPIQPWWARVAVAPMIRGSSVAVGWPLARRVALSMATLLVLLAAVLAVVGAIALRDRLNRSDLFVYVVNPGTLPADFCIEGRDCRNALAGWPGGRFLVSQPPYGPSSPRVIVEAPWPSTILDFSLSPDGALVAYVRTQIGYPATCRQLVVVDRRTGSEGLVVEYAADPSSFGWWPDADKLAFVTGGRCSPGGYGVFMADIDEGSLKQVLDLETVVPSPDPRVGPGVDVQAWHPDGRHLLLGELTRPLEDRGLRPTRQLIVALEDVSNPMALDCDCDPWGAAWSPDGSRLLLETRHDLLVGSWDGTGLRSVAESATNARWSPNGEWIAFFSEPPGEGPPPRDWNRDLFIVGAAGGEVRRLAGVEHAFRPLFAPPLWSPDGEWIYWSDVDGTWAIRPDGTDLGRLDLPAPIDLQWVTIEDR